MVDSSKRERPWHVIGANVKRLRDSQMPPWTRRVLSEKSQQSISSIERIENGSRVKTSTIFDVAAALGVTIEELEQPFDPTKSPPPSASPPPSPALSTDPASIVERWRESVLVDRFFTHLPPTLGDDAPLPMASMYVELRVADDVRPSATSEQIAPWFSIAQEQHNLYERRRARRFRVEDVFNASGPRHVIVLGDPGGGKTSMLKRLTLDIAGDRLPRWRVPLHVSLATWWRSRSHAQADSLPLDLFTHICKDMLSCARVGPGNVSTPRSVLHGSHTAQWDDAVAALAQHLLERADGGRGDVLLLMDGFDELSGDLDAVETVLTQLRWLTPRLSWLMTSRRAGFDGRVLPDERYELTELDAEGIHRLVENWFEHHPRPADPGQLLRWLEQGSSSWQIAHNPFLLSLLCRIHQDGGPNTQLPTTRVGVYREIFALARRQMNAAQRRQDHAPLATQRYLGRFCHWLYSDAARAPRQLFGADDWETFLVALPKDWCWRRDPAPSLDADLLRARLLDRWGEQGDYHVVHLTLHEFLVAEDVIDTDPDALQIHRDEPAWREILRFGAALAWELGQRDSVETLLRSLIEPEDLNGLRYIEVARILAELPLRDTSELFGWDLRVRLWEIWRDDLAYVSQAAASALALLDRDWAVERAIGVLGGDEHLLVSAGGETELYRRLSAMSAMGSSLEDPRHAAIQLLGAMATPAAIEALFELLGRDSEPTLARRSADVLAEIDDPKLRDRLRAWATASARSPAQRIVATVVARKDPRPEWTPWLLECLDDPHAILQQHALSALTSIRDPRGAAPLIARLEANPAFETDHRTLEALMATPGEVAQRWLDQRWTQATNAADGAPEVALAMVHGLIMRGTLTDRAIVDLIDDCNDDDCEDVLEQVFYAIQDRSEQGVPSEAILLERLHARCTGTSGSSAAQALCAAAAANLRHGGDANLVDLLVDFLQHDDEDVRASAANSLGASGNRVPARSPAEDRLLELLDDPEQPMHVQSAALGALGVWSKVSDSTLARLEALVVDERLEPDLRASAAEALASLDVARLGPLRDSEHGRRALAKFAAERAHLVFDHGHVDPSGKLHRWSGEA